MTSIRSKVEGPSISVVIPVLDDALALHRCLDALSRQVGPRDEIIVVDNGSADRSREVAKAAGARVLVEPVRGIAAASATGYDAARGDVIARLDSDCVPGQDWLERIRRRFGDDRALEGLTGRAVFNDGPRGLRQVGAWLYLTSYFLVGYATLGHTVMFGSNCALRRTTWTAMSYSVHRADRMVHDDLDLSFHVGPVRSIRFDPQLAMTMAMPPFTVSSWLLRIRRGVHSVILHWPNEFPWYRWFRRAAHTTNRRSEMASSARRRLTFAAPKTSAEAFTK